MLAPALRLVTDALAGFIEARTGVAGAAMLGPLAAASSSTDALVVSLVRLEPEMPSQSYNPRGGGLGGPARTEVPVALSAGLLVMAMHADYADALAAIDYALSGLRQRPVIEATGVEDVQRLTVEIEPLSFADLHHLWATVGAPHRPSVVLRVRILGSEPRLLEPIRPVTVVEGPAGRI